MSSLYIHIPYCKKLCYYCDFHFSLNLKTRGLLIPAICKELEMQKHFFNSQEISTLYFGGGTPSILSQQELLQIFRAIRDNYLICSDVEITFECNPDDLTIEYLSFLHSLGINRLSIGIQSFYDDDLVMLNRRHSANTARKAVKMAQSCGFKNVTVDLIYGLPGMTLERWKYNLSEVEKLGVQHLSAYSLMVEEYTALHKFVKTGKFILPNDDVVVAQFEYLVNWASKNGFEQYEISNFAKSNYVSKHNSSYWTGKSYLGVGPSAHSFDGKKRFWNISHNAKYIESINSGILPQEVEILSQEDMFNEFIMTALRMNVGISIRQLQNDFPEYYSAFAQQTEKFIHEGLLQENKGRISFTRQGIMLSDMIMSELFESKI